MKTTTKTIDQVLTENPDLHIGGFEYFGRIREVCLNGKMVTSFREDPCEEQIQACLDWLADVKATRTILRVSSYGLKHAVQRDCEQYITNGAFIVAALMVGFPMQRHIMSPDPRFGISKKDFKRKWNDVSEREKQNYVASCSK